MTPILILAAGRSSRMGDRDKLMEDVGGEPLLRRQVRMARATGHPVYVALGVESAAHQAVIADFDAVPLCVEQSSQGIGGTISGAVARLPEGTDVMILLADLVALETSDLQTMFAAQQDAPECLVWRGATDEGKPGHPVIFGADLRPALAALHGDQGASKMLGALKDQTALVALPDNRALLDLDTPDEWAAWRRASR